MQGGCKAVSGVSRPKAASNLLFFVVEISGSPLTSTGSWVDEMSTSRSRSEMHRLSFRTPVPTRRLSTWREFSRAIDMWGTGAVLELHQSISNDFSDSLSIGRTGNWSHVLPGCWGASGSEVFCESFGILNKLTKLLQSGSEWYNVMVGLVAT